MILQNQEIKIKIKKGRKTIYFFIFITSLSFVCFGSLGSCVYAAVVDTSTFSLGSSFGGMVRVANTSSMLWEVSFSLEVSLRAGGDSSKPWTTSILTSPAFELSSACSTPFEIVPTARGALGGQPWSPKSFEGVWSVLSAFCLPQHGKSLNPGLVEGYIPYQVTISPAHS